MTSVSRVNGKYTHLLTILNCLPLDPAPNKTTSWRVVANTDPGMAFFHLLAGWLAGQSVVLAGSVEKARDILGDTPFVVAKDIELREGGLGQTARLDALIKALDFPTGADDPAALILSSGSTGAPKGILLSRRAIMASANVLLDPFALTRDEVFGNLSPVHSMGGLRAFALCLNHQIGTKFFDTKANQGLSLAHQVLTSGVAVILSGSSFVRLLSAGKRMLSTEKTDLRAIMSCGSLYDDAASADVRDVYGIDVVNAYGQTETAGIVMCEPLGMYRPGLMPPPLPGTVQHFRDIGGDTQELGIEYATPFCGYFGSDPHQGPIVWTGDLVTRDAQGVRFRGRASHAVKTRDGAGWLFPDLLENWLRDVAGFSDAAIRPKADHSGLWGVVSADLPVGLAARIAADLGNEYAAIKLHPGRIERSPGGKLKVMET